MTCILQQWSNVKCLNVHNNQLILIARAFGLIFYFVGRQRGESKSKLFPFFYGLSGTFIVLGIITIFGALAFYNIGLQSWRFRGGEFTMLDHTRYRTWAISGVLWIISGGIFLTF